jgi:hypothetical protein
MLCGGLETGNGYVVCFILGVCRNETDSSGRIESAAMHKATYFII